MISRTFASVFPRQSDLQASEILLPLSYSFLIDRAILPGDLRLAVLVIAGLIVTSLWILRPFLPAVIWATTLVIATWPIMRRLQDRLWGKRALAVTVGARL